jgi:hypothetical protein
MPGRYLPRRDYLALKAATALLTEHAGGASLIARGISRVHSKSTICKYGSNHPDHAELFAPIDVVADLEAKVEEPIVTRELARLCGFALVRLPARDGDGIWFDRLAALAKETGEVMARLATALAGDYRVTAAEIARLRILEEIGEAEGAIAQIRAALEQIVDEAEPAE